MSDEQIIDGVDDETDTEIKPEPKKYTEADMAGIVAQRDSLMDEKKNAQRKAEAIKLQAEQEIAKKSGELDKFEASLRGEFDKERGGLTAKLEALTNRVVGESKKAVLGSFTGDFIAPESLDLISQLVKTEFDGENVKTQYTDFSGNVITTDAAEFKKWMSNHPAISHLMKADAANGGGAPGSKQVNGGAMNGRNEAAETAKSKGDAIGTLNERLKGQFKL